MSDAHEEEIRVIGQRNDSNRAVCQKNFQGLDRNHSAIAEPAAAGVAVVVVLRLGIGICWREKRRQKGRMRD